MKSDVIRCKSWLFISWKKVLINANSVYKLVPKNTKLYVASPLPLLLCRSYIHGLREQVKFTPCFAVVGPHNSY